MEGESSWGRVPPSPLARALLRLPRLPAGKMFTRAELEELAAVLDDFPRVVLVSDEVRERGRRAEW